MLNHRTRTHRSSSSIFAGLNKQNNYDVGNCLQRYQDKYKSKINHQLILQENKIKLPILKKKSTIQPEKLIQQIKSPQLIVLQNIPVDVKKIENQILKQIYSQDILQFLKVTDQLVKPNQILNNHGISKQLRAKMVDWMIQVLSSYKCSQYTFFTAVRLLDTFFMKCKTRHDASQLHLTGVACIFMACKYQQIYPLKLRIIYEKIAHKKLSKQQIIKKESEILSNLNFDLLGVNNYELLLQTIEMIEFQRTLDEKIYRYFKKICLYLSKMVLYDCDLLNTYSFSTLASANIYVAFKIIQQLLPNFSPDEKIKQVTCLLGLRQERMVQCAAKILNLAKSFEKIYPNLHNLRKFNDFSMQKQGFQSQRSGINQ